MLGRHSQQHGRIVDGTPEDRVVAGREAAVGHDPTGGQLLDDRRRTGSPGDGVDPAATRHQAVAATTEPARRRAAGGRKPRRGARRRDPQRAVGIDRRLLDRAPRVDDGSRRRGGRGSIRCTREPRSRTAHPTVPAVKAWNRRSAPVPKSTVEDVNVAASTWVSVVADRFTAIASAPTPITSTASPGAPTRTRSTTVDVGPSTRTTSPRSGSGNQFAPDPSANVRAAVAHVAHVDSSPALTVVAAAPPAPTPGPSRRHLPLDRRRPPRRRQRPIGHPFGQDVAGRRAGTATGEIGPLCRRPCGGPLQRGRGPHGTGRPWSPTRPAVAAGARLSHVTMFPSAGASPIPKPGTAPTMVLARKTLPVP